MQHAGLFEPTPEELSILKTFESRANFRVVEVPGISEGRQSRVSVLEYEAKGVKKQVMWKRMGVGKGITHDEAQVLERHLYPYREGLRRFGWNVPEIYHSQVVQVGQEYQIFSYDQFISGGDAEQMVIDPDEPNFKKWHLLREIVRQLCRYPDSATTRVSIEGEELTALPHGLDLKLANVVVAEDGTYFVDFFGPKEIDRNGNWATYSPKLDSLSPEQLRGVTATREGAFLRLHRLLERKWSSVGSIGAEELRQKSEELIKYSMLPEREKSFILAEIEKGYQWLDRIYTERAV